MVAEYVAKIKGDTSQLEQVLKKAQGTMRQLEDNEVLIKLDYNGNIAQFNKVFDQVVKACPDLTVQFQYNANKKILDQEIEKLNNLEKIKIGIDDKSFYKDVTSKLKEITNDVSGTTSLDDIGAKIKDLFRYVNTGKELGATIGFDLSEALTNALEGTRAEDFLGDLFANVNVEKLSLFKVTQAIDDEIYDTQERIKDLQVYMNKLLTKGASTSGKGTSEFEQLQEEVKILKSDIKDLQDMTSSTTGDMFKSMSDDIQLLNDKLNETLRKISIIQDPNSYSLGNTIKEWQKEGISDKERFAVFNSKTKEVSSKDLSGEAEQISGKLIRKAINNAEIAIDGVVHTHPQKFAAASDADIEIFYSLLNEGITKQVIASFDQAMTLDMSQVNPTKSNEVIQTIKDEYETIDDVLKQSFLNGKKNEILEIGSTVLSGVQTKSPVIQDILNNAKSNFENIINSLGEKIHWDDFEDAVDTALEEALKSANSKYSFSSENIDVLKNNFFAISEEIISPLREQMSSQAQLQYQEVLLDVFNNPTFLKQGANTAIKLQPIEDFIDFSSISKAAEESAKAAEEATKKAQDSNSPSKVAEKLGEYWGIGYAEGIKKTKPEIEAAIRYLIDDLQLSAQDLIAEDLEKELKGPISNILKNPKSSQQENLKALIEIEDIQNDIDRRTQQLYDDNQKLIEEHRKNNYSNKDSISLAKSSPTQTFDNEIQQNLVMLENYKNTIAEIDRLKLEPETDETKHKIEELNKLADYFAAKITTIQSENGHEINRSMMQFNGTWNDNLRSHYTEEQRKDFWKIAGERSGLNRDTVFTEFSGISEELERIEEKSNKLASTYAKDVTESRSYVSRLKADLVNLVETQEELANTSPKSKDYALYTKDLDVFSKRSPEVLQFLDKLKTYEQANEFVKTDEWVNFLATLPKAHDYLESIGYDFERLSQQSNETPDLFQDESGQLSFIEDLIQTEEKAAEGANELAGELSKVNDQISGQMSLDDLENQQQQAEEKLLPAVIETNEAYIERMRIADQAFQATMRQTNEEKINRSIAESIKQECKEQERLNEAKKEELSISPITPQNQPDTQAKESAQDVDAESKSFDKVKESANKAAEFKKKFAKANKEVSDSAKKSKENVDKEKDSLNNLNKAASSAKNNQQYNGIYLDQTGLTTDDHFSYTERTGYYQRLATRVNRDNNGNVQVDSTFHMNYKGLQDEIMKTDTALIKLTEDIHKAQEAGADITPLRATEQILDDYLKALEKEYENYLTHTEYVPENAQRSWFNNERNKNRNIEQNKVDQRVNNKLAVDQEREINRLYGEQITNLRQIDSLNANISKNYLSENEEKQQQIIQNQREIYRLEQQNAQIERDRNNLISQFGRDTTKVNDLLKVQEEHNRALVKEDETRVAKVKESSRQSKIEDSTAHNNKAVSLYKELIKQAREYYELKAKSDQGILSTDEQERLNVLEQKWSDASSKVNEYSIAIDGSTDSLRKLINIQNEFDNNSINIANLQEREKLIKDLSKVSSWKTNANNGKYISDLVNDIKTLDVLLQNVNQNGINLTDNKGKVDLQQILELKQRIESREGLRQYRQASETTIEKIRNKIRDFMNKNTAMSKEFRDQLEHLDVRLDSAKTLDDTDKVLNAFIKIENEVTKADQLGKSFFRTMKERWTGLTAQWVAQFLSFQDIIRYIQEIARTVTEVDSALTELRKVSDATNSRLQQSFEKSAETAKELGSTITDVINITSDWARLGYSVDQAEELARVTTLFKTVGDNMTAESASSYLVSTMQGFKLATDEAEHIIDVYNEVANNFAIDTAGIGEAMQRSAASFNAANTSLEKSVALVTATNAVVQDPDSVGTLWKTLSARIRGAKSELIELGEEEDTIIESTSKLRDMVKGMTGFDIMKDEDTFKDIYDIILGIGKEWSSLTDIQQASLGEALAGKRNANALFAVLNNVEMLESAYKTAEDSAGSAMKEQANYAKSIQYSVDRLKASWQEFLTSLLSSGTVKNIVDLGNSAIKILDTIATHPVILSGGLSAILGGVATKNGFDIVNAFTKLGSFINNVPQLTKNFASGISVLNKYKLSLKDIQGLEEALTGSSIVLNQQQKAYRDNVLNTIPSLEKQQSALKGLENATKATTAAQSLLTSAITAGVVFAATEIISALINYERDLANQAQQAADKYNELSSSVDTYSSRISALYEKINSGNLTLEEHIEANTELRNIQKELIDNFGSEAVGIDLVTQSLEAQADQLERVNSLKGSQNALAEFRNEINKDTASQTVLNIAGRVAGYLGTTFIGGPVGKVLGIANISEGWTDVQNVFGSNLNKMNHEYENFSETIKATSDDTFNYIIESYNNVRKTTNGDFEIFGNVEDVKDTIIKLRNDYKNFPGYTEEWANSLNSVYNKADDIVKEFGDAYHAQIQMTIAANEEYLALQEEISQAYKDYEEANIVGDKSAMDEAAQRYIDAVNKVRDTISSQTYQDAIINIVPVIANPNEEEFNTLIDEYIGGKFKFDTSVGIQIPIGFDDSDIKTFEKVQRLYKELTEEGYNYGTIGQFFTKVANPSQYTFSSTQLQDWGITNKDITRMQNNLQGYIDLANSGFEATENLVKATNWFGSDFTRLMSIIEKSGPVVNWDDLLAFSDFQNTLQIIENEFGITADEIKEILLRKGLIIQDGVKEQIRDFVNSNVTATNEDTYVKEMRIRDTNALIEKISRLWRAEDLNNLPYIWKYIDIPPNTVPTWEQMNRALKEYYSELKQIDAISRNVNLPFQTVDDLADVESAVNSLSDIYNEVVQMTSSSNADGFGFADPAKINSIEQAFMKLAEAEDEATQAKLTLALKDFEETLVLFPNDTEKAQQAINRLITSYINESSILDDLTEETKEYVAARLKIIGVTNSEQVVESRLSKSVQATTAAVADLREEYNKYYEVLKNINNMNNGKGGANLEFDQQTQDAIAQLKPHIIEALGVFGEDGELLQKFQISDEFIQEHWDSVERMINGDEDAINELRQELMREQFKVNVGVNMPEEATEAYFNRLWDNMMWFSKQEIKCTATLDDAPFVRMLSAMLAKAALTRQEVDSILGAGGYTGIYDKKNGGLTGARPYEDLFGDTANYGPSTLKDDTSGGGGGSSSDEDPIVKEYENAMNNLQWLRENNFISEKEYLDQSRALYEKYYGQDLAKYAQQYYEAQKKYLEELKKYYEDVLGAITSLLDDEIEKYNRLEETEKKVYEEEIKNNQKLIKDLQKRSKAIDKIIKQLEKEKKQIQKDNIDPLQEQIDSRQEVIKSIEDEITLMQRANDERERQLDLAKKNYDLQRLMHQRTQLVFYMPKTIVI